MAEPELIPRPATPILSVVPQPKPLTPKQKYAALLYSQCKSWAEICRTARISRATLSNWFNKPEFMVEVNRLVDRVQETSETKLRALQDVALESLQRAMTDKPGSVASVRAASIIMANKPTKRPAATGTFKIAFGGLRRIVEKETKDA